MSSSVIHLIDAATAISLSDEIRDIYRIAFSPPPFNRPPTALANFGLRQFPMHLERKGFAMTTASDSDGRLVGFAYGYTGKRGQFWSDVVASVIGADAAATWIGDHFEFAELALLPRARGEGIGRALTSELLDSRAEPRALLQVAEYNAIARSLYASLGFVRIGRTGDQLFLGRQS